MVRMALDADRHMDAEEIERYSLGSIPGDDLPRLEEHLLLCESCRHRITESDVYVASMRQAGRKLHTGNKVRVLRAAALSVLVAACIVVFLMTVRPGHQSAPASPFAIHLEATRGTGVQTKAPAGRRLELQFELVGLATSPRYRAEIVDGDGTRLWDGSAALGATRATASAPPLAAGVYFVRLYLPSGELLREYALAVGASR